MNLQPLFRLYARAFARPVFYKVHRLLYNLSLRGMGVLNWETDDLQGETAILRRFVASAPSGAIVLDVGANVGKYSRSVRSIAPQVNLHSFEPSPQAFAELQAAMSGDDVRCVRAAVGSVEGTATLFDHAGAAGSGHATLQGDVIERIHGGVAKATQVPVIRLDRYIREERIESVFWLKIDVEGREADVLRGLGDLFTTGFEIHYIQIEFNEMNALSKTFLEDLCEMLSGYRVYRILPGGKLVDISTEALVLREIFAFQNLLFSKSDLCRR